MKLKTQNPIGSQATDKKNSIPLNTLRSACPQRLGSLNSKGYGRGKNSLKPYPDVFIKNSLKLPRTIVKLNRKRELIGSAFIKILTYKQKEPFSKQYSNYLVCKNNEKKVFQIFLLNRFKCTQRSKINITQNKQVGIRAKFNNYLNKHAKNMRNNFKMK